MNIEGYAAAKDQEREIFWDEVGAGYFKALQVPVLLGREFGPQDTATSSRVFVINESAAKFYFGKASPIGRRIWLDDPKDADKPLKIICAVRDILNHPLPGP